MLDIIINTFCQTNTRPSQQFDGCGSSANDAKYMKFIRSCSSFCLICNFSYSLLYCYFVAVAVAAVYKLDRTNYRMKLAT